MYHYFDEKFIKHFHNLKQVFLYITDECNLRCAHCIYKPNLTFSLRKKNIEINKAAKLISDFKDLGAFKITILGGEPTLYEDLLELINIAKNLCYEHIRISTNGTFGESLLLEPNFKKLNEIAFSLDGFSSEINDSIRGIGTFDKCVENIKKSIKFGYKVSITCCIHNKLLQRDDHGNLLIDSMIRFAESLGVDIINFHDLFKVGVPMDTWTGNFETSVNDWILTYNEIRNNIIGGNYNISVRLPLCFITKEEFKKNPEYYGYCPVKMGERIMIHSNGVIRVCSNLICSPYHIAKYNDSKISWNKSNTNEILNHKVTLKTPCTNRGKKDYGSFIPLCFSFKPNQEEIVWKKLKWDNRRKSKLYLGASI